MNNNPQGAMDEEPVTVVLCNGDLFYTTDMAGYVSGLKVVALIALVVAPLWLLLLACMQG